MEYEPPNNPTVENFDYPLLVTPVIMEYEPPNNPTVENFDYSLVVTPVSHKTPISALMEFLKIKAELQRRMSFLIDREYESVVIRVFVGLVCPGGQSMDMDRAIKTHAHDIFSRFSGPIPLSFKEKLDETVDDGTAGDFDPAVSMFVQLMYHSLGKLADLLSNEQMSSQIRQIYQLSVISETIHAIRARLGRPHNDEFLKPESPYVDSVFPRVVLRWGCRSALIVYSRIKKELQRQVGELINREDNSSELWLFNYYGVCSGASMEDAIRTSATKIFKRFFGRIPQWYKKMEAKRTDEMKNESDDETDDEIEGFNLNVSLYCEDICRQVEELLGLVSVDKTPQIEQLLRIAYEIKDFKRNLAKVGWMPVEEGEGEYVTEDFRAMLKSLEEMSLVKKHEEDNEEESERVGEEMSSVKKHEEKQSERAGEETSSVKKHEEQSERAGEEIVM